MLAATRTLSKDKKYSPLKVNPEPDETDDPEISVLKGSRNEDNDDDYYDIDEAGIFDLF